MNGAKSVQVRIEGRVQGVWYRAWTRGEAVKRGLAGWVRNRADGSVEALFSGPADAVDAMVRDCWDGPPAARVDRIAVNASSPPSSPGFQQLPTL
ncbi:MAG: acylphosphatase [Magnetospirillum sp. WYHS-4]